MAMPFGFDGPLESQGAGDRRMMRRDLGGSFPAQSPHRALERDRCFCARRMISCLLARALCRSRPHFARELWAIVRRAEFVAQMAHRAARRRRRLEVLKRTTIHPRMAALTARRHPRDRRRGRNVVRRDGARPAHDKRLVALAFIGSLEEDCLRADCRDRAQRAASCAATLTTAIYPRGGALRALETARRATGVHGRQ